MSATMRRVQDEKDDWVGNRGYNDVEMSANKTRIRFLDNYVLDVDTNSYKTVEEREWLYLVKREYRYKVQLPSIGYGVMIGTATAMWRMYVKKSFVFWPFLVLPAILYAPISRELYLRSNWRLFAMCNLGVQYPVGKIRNEVLKEVNAITGHQDF